MPGAILRLSRAFLSMKDDMIQSALYLITGGCGFIGSHIAEELVALGRKVRILDNLSFGYVDNIAHIKDKVEFQKGDIRNPKDIDIAIKGAKYVFHEAALVSVFDSVNRPVDNNDINITGTLNVLESAKKNGVKRVVMASSAAVYGNNPDLPKTENMKPEPESPYAVGKIIGEYYFKVFSSLYGLETVALRYFNVYGPRQDPSSMYSGVISKFSDCLAKKEAPTIFGDGGQTRDFVFVKDIVSANILAMNSPKAGKGDVFNVGTGKQVSLLQLLEAMNGIVGHDYKPSFKDARSGDIRFSVSDISRAQEELGYKPKFSLKNGLEELLRSLKVIS